MNLEELSSFLNLEKVRIRGNEIHASCPFPENHHSGKDSHPSFSVNVEKGVYNCFSCESRGTIEELVSKLQGIPVYAALEKLQELGFDRIAVNLQEPPKEEKRPEILPEALLLYFDEVESDFAEIYEGEIEGLDCFIFPIRNMQGKLVGAIARSKEGRFHKMMWHYSKKLYLYGEDKVEREKPIIIVEGVRDAISLRKAGYWNTLALVGMHMSDEQVEKALLLSSEFIVWLDKDSAGAKGLQTVLKKMENRANMRYVDPWKQLPDDCKDPRDVYEKHGIKKVHEIVRGAKTYLEHLLV